MSADPAAPGPRLVYDADAASADRREPAAPVAGRDRSRSWLVALLLAFALLAGFEWRRAAALEAHVAELAASLATAQAEIEARRAQLGAIRASVEDLSQRLAALARVAAEDPTAPSLPSADTNPAQ